MPLAECPEWSVPPHALQINKYGDGTDGRRIVLLATHPTYPFVGDVAADPNEFEKSLQWLAFCYLKELKIAFDAHGVDFLPLTWMQALDPAAGAGLHPIAWWSLAEEVPLASQVLERFDDQTIVLVAGTVLSLEQPKGTFPYPSGFGVRIVLRRLTKGGTSFAITSMTAHLPSLEYSDSLFGIATGDEPNTKQQEELERLLALDDSFDPSVILDILASVSGQEPSSVSIAEFRVLKRERTEDDRPSFETVTYGRDADILPRHSHSAYPTGGYEAVATRFSIDSEPGIIESSVQKIAKWPIYSDATVDVPVFKQEPTSNKDLEDVPIYDFILRPGHKLDADVRETVTIEQDQTSDLFVVQKCPDFVKNDADNGPYRFVVPPDGKVHPRSDLQSAISAFHHFDTFFQQVDAFGLKGKSLLRRTNLPVQVHYRSGIAPGRGKDGNTVNARVALVNETDSGALLSKPITHVHLALADLNRWHRNVPTDAAFAPRPAQPLGFANSKRWFLHEIAHVLIAGVLGELEFRFAHSIGDALAAVLCDPDSRIAEADPNGPWASFRYQTFPWIFTTRRHDRSVLTGWSWSGTMHRDVQNTPELQLRGLKGYRTEQILSTTIFRLYRTLGGDTVAEDGKPDVARRCDASRVVLYLILRAIESFVHWPLRAEELESALIDADVCLTGPLTSDVGDIWSGGQAHKVIRWVFEAQGMHPAKPDEINNGIGAPPPVDIFIKDQRNGLEHTIAGTVEHGLGSYVPVSLHWNANAEWTGGTVSLTEQVIVFGNRGNEDPGTVSMRAWFGISSEDTIDWLTQPIKNANISQHIDTAAVSLSELGIDLPSVPTSAQLVLLVEITCESDRANTDPNTEFNCKIPAANKPNSSRRKITDLVATDNNLALFWISH